MIVVNPRYRLHMFLSINLWDLFYFIINQLEIFNCLEKEYHDSPQQTGVILGMIHRYDSGF